MKCRGDDGFVGQGCSVRRVNGSIELVWDLNFRNCNSEFDLQCRCFEVYLSASDLFDGTQLQVLHETDGCWEGDFFVNLWGLWLRPCPCVGISVAHGSSNDDNRRTFGRSVNSCRSMQVDISISVVSQCRTHWLLHFDTRLNVSCETDRRGKSTFETHHQTNLDILDIPPTSTNPTWGTAVMILCHGNLLPRLPLGFPWAPRRVLCHLGAFPGSLLEKAECLCNFTM